MCTPWRGVQQLSKARPRIAYSEHDVGRRWLTRHSFECSRRYWTSLRRRISVPDMRRLRRYRNDKPRHMGNSLVLRHSRCCVDIGPVRQVGNDRATLGTALLEWVVKMMQIQVHSIISKTSLRWRILAYTRQRLRRRAFCSSDRYL